MIDRPRLTHLLDQILARRLTLVIGGAGYGKSTLIRGWAVGRTVAWVGLRDEPGSGGGLVAAILRAFGRAGIDLAAVIDPALASAAMTDATEDASRAEALAGVIASAFEASGVDDAVLVLDDVHDLATGEAGDAIVGALVRQAPPGLHVVLVSRSAPPFRTERLRAHGDLVEIGVEDLAMDTDEVTRLLDMALGSSDARLAARLVEATAGWPAVISLVVESIRRLPATERAAAVGRTLESGEALFPYLAEEVLDAEPPAVRELIQTVAPLDTFDADLCEALGIVGAAELLRELRSRGMFIAAAQDRPGRLAMHRLVREFAMRRLPLADVRLADVRRAGAEWLAAGGDIEAALRMAADTGDGELIRSLLRANGTDLVQRGRVDVIAAVASAVGQGEAGPDVALVIGDACSYRGEWREAEAWYRRASGPADELPAAVAWRLGRLYFERSEFERAAEVVERGTQEGAAPGDRARLVAWRALAAWHGDRPDAGDLATAAIAEATAWDDLGAISLAETAMCYALLATDVATARVHHARALAAADEGGDIVQQIRLRGAGDAFWPVRRQIEELTRILPVAEAAGNRRWLARAVFFRANCLIDAGELEPAEAELRRAQELAARVGPDENVADLFLADLHRMRGDLIQAAEAYRAHLAREGIDRDSLAFAKGGLARILATTEPEASAGLAASAIDLVLPHHRYDALLSAGWVALCQGRTDDAAALAAEAIRLVTQGEGALEAARGYALELAAMATSDRTTRRATLEEAAVTWRRVGNATETAAVALALAQLDGGREGRIAEQRARAELRAAGIGPAAADAACLLAVLPAERSPSVEIRTLGGFSVRRYGAPVPLADWRSKKPRDILKLLIARRGPVTREELVEAVWPDEPPDATSNRLSVALSHLRAVLDPAHERPPDAFVWTDRTALRLVVDEVALDLEDFMREARDGLELVRRGRGDEALDRLLGAEATYGGDLFEEDPFADWATGPREEARATYIQVARTIAELLAARGDHDVAGRYLMRIVARDPFDEAAHLQLVATLARARHHGEARRAYQSYVARMAELEIEPAAYPAGA